MSASEAGTGGAARVAALEEVRSMRPFMVRRRVKWGEVGIAGIVYPARFADYVLEAIESCYRALTGVHWSQNHERFGFGTPASGLSLEFGKPLRPDDLIDVEVDIERIGHASYTVGVRRRDDEGADCFEGVVRFVVVDDASRKPISIPAFLRERLEWYRDGLDNEGATP